VQAKVLARRGDLDDAVRLAREAVSWYEDSDFINLHGDALMDLGEVLDRSGHHAEALEASREALAKYERKGDVPAIDRARRRIAEWEQQ
jgi:tetratricopeptide (TPR) repeat protein